MNLPETITVWTRTSGDGFGGGNWSPPASYPARIAYRQDKFTDTNGNDRTSTAVCYTEAPVEVADLARGIQVLFAESTAVEPPAEADDVRVISQTPSGAGELKKLWFA